MVLNTNVLLRILPKLPIEHDDDDNEVVMAPVAANWWQRASFTINGARLDPVAELNTSCAVLGDIIALHLEDAPLQH